MDKFEGVVVRIPAYDPDEGTPVFWNDECRCSVRAEKGMVAIEANASALMELGKQFISLAMGKDGDHVHLDGFFCGNGLGGAELVISKKDDTK